MVLGKKRVSGQTRRDLILRAALPVFARHGLNGTTTRMLAQAAGVSEALLYRHFPSKEALYDEIGRDHLREEAADPAVEALLTAPPGTKRLVDSVHYLIAHVHYGETDLFPRLMAQSLLDDGALARGVLGKFREEFLPFLEDSIAAARRSGDLIKGAEPSEAETWLVQQLAFGLRLHALPRIPVLRPVAGVDPIDRAVRFALRGLGLRRKAIERHYDAQRWAMLAK